MADDNSICTVEDCRNPRRAHGLCQKHYMRLRNTGSPTGTARKKPKTLAWLESAATMESDKCYLWPFAVGTGGYGNVNLGGKYTNAHRVVCRLAHGEPDVDGLEAAHSCGNRLCCNPKHLSWATHIENETHKVAHGRLRRGEEVTTSKLTRDEVRGIRQMADAGKSLAENADAHGVSKKQAWQIIARKTWAWLE